MNEQTKNDILAHLTFLDNEIEKTFRITAELDPRSEIYWKMYRHYKETQAYREELRVLLA